MVAIYARLMSSSFISFDDSVYVVDNPFINKGLTWEGIKAVFNLHQEGGSYWHPVTSLSHMTDCTLFGLAPSMHHMVNILIHGLNAALLANILLLCTKDRMKSFWVGVIFAFHPLNVETVAWISERKNLLAALFFLLGLLAYARFVKKRTIVSYMTLLAVFFLGLMSKPTMMTFPFTLFLFHYWPLNGYDVSGPPSVGAFVKKNKHHFLPVLGLIAILMVMFVVVFFMGGNQSRQASLDYIPLGLRISNMFVADITYLAKLVMPVNLSVFQPYPKSIPLAKALVAFLILLGASVIAFIHARKWPFAFVGWFWYVGNLVPASGLLQRGYFPAYADRFTYLPMIGVFILIAWGIPRYLEQWKMSQRIITCVGYGIVLLLSLVTFKQTEYWKNGITLFSHAVEVNPDDVVSMTNLALALGESGQLDKAIEVSRKALTLEPDYAEALNNMGTLYAKKGDIERALPFFERALDVFPGFKLALENRKMAVQTLATYDKKELMLRKELAENPGSVELASSLARILAVREKYDEAEAIYLDLLKKHPEAGASISYNLACLHSRADNTDKAIHWLEISLRKGFKAWNHMATDPDLDNVRQRGDYPALIDLYRYGMKE